MTTLSRFQRRVAVAAILVSATLVIALPVLADPLVQQGENAQRSVTEVFLKQPDLVAPLVVPMLGACGGILILGAFLAWALSRM